MSEITKVSINVTKKEGKYAKEGKNEVVKVAEFREEEMREAEVKDIVKKAAQKGKVSSDNLVDEAVKELRKMIITYR